MQLMLSLQGTSPIEGTTPTYTLSGGSAIIGRAPTTDWYLPDARRILSKTHCRLDRQPNGFTVTDLSTNGVLVNGEQVGYEQSRLLADGDKLKLGDFDLSVSITTGADAAGAEEADAPFPDGPFGGDVADQRSAEASVPAETGNNPACGNDTNGTPSDTQTLLPTDAIVISLVQSFPDLDTAGLAAAIDAAGTQIPEAEWQAFYRRLRAFLQSRHQTA